MRRKRERKPAEGTRGSHRQFKHPVQSGLVTIAGNLSHDLAPGTWNSMLKQAGLKGEE
ncbi:MAG: type II toxin-antitoxin system HicA family toxin [Chloroflexi bacterium]|nr:type II toxin-antitoxin system HicA family toxin [Chloroflexota bacterium]